MKIFTLILFLTSFTTVADVPLPVTEVSASNFKDLGWFVHIEEIDEEGFRYGLAKFPLELESGLVAMRVQFGTTDLSGNDLTASSSDALIQDKEPEVFFAYKPNLMDAYACIHYGFVKENKKAYVESFCINSFEQFSHNK
mgnify:CR=1 FL=1